MSFIKTIRDEIVDPNVAASTVLRKAKIIAATLANDELTQWLGSELNGYSGDGLPLPDYRVIHSPLLGRFQGYAGSSVTNFQLPVSMLPEFMRENCEEIPMSQSLKQLESMAANSSANWQHTLPTEAVLLSRDAIRLSGGMELVAIYQLITIAMLEGILDKVRTRFLDFLLSLQEIDSGILESEEAIGNLPPQGVQSAFTLNVYGNNNVIPTQSTVGNISIQNIRQGDFESLQGYLNGLGVSPEDTNELKDAIDSDGTPEEGKLGGGVGKWIGGMVTKSISGAWNSTVEVVGKVLTDAMSQYYGW